MKRYISKLFSKANSSHELDIMELKLKSDVDDYFNKNKDRLDNIEGYWTSRWSNEIDSKEKIQSFIVKKGECSFIKGSILDNDEVKFYTSSDIAIQKLDDDKYIFLVSETAKTTRRMTTHKPFRVLNSKFIFESITSYPDEDYFRKTTHSYSRGWTKETKETR